MAEASWMLSRRTAVVSLTASMAVLAALTLIDVRDVEAILGISVLCIALCVAVLDVVLVVRSLFKRRWRLAMAGLIGLLLIFPGPVAVCFVMNSMWAARAERLALERLRESGDVEGLGTLRALEGSGYEISRMFWDMGGVSGHLVLLRRGRFESRDFPVVIVASRDGSLGSSSLVILPGRETLLRYTNAERTPEGNAVLEGSVLQVAVGCRSPFPW